LIVPACFVSAQNLQDAFKTDTGSGNPLAETAAKAGYQSADSGNSVEKTVGIVIQTFLAILGVIFLVLMIYAGYAWMTAHGDEQKVTKAKETITAAIIGLVIIIGAYAISFYVIKALSTNVLQTAS
jgi:lysylphosphatidylglycerol synthetase-like protein (DUF2156 family)